MQIWSISEKDAVSNSSLNESSIKFYLDNRSLEFTNK